MTLRNCIDSARDQGQISEKQATELRAKFDDLMTVHKDPTKVKQIMLEQLRVTGEERQRIALLTATVLKKLDTEVFRYVNEDGEFDPAEGWRTKFQHVGVDGRGITDADTKHRMLQGQAMGQLSAFQAEYRKKFLIGGGLNRMRKSVRARLDDVGRALMKETVKDEQATAFADSITRVLDDLRVRANEAGANIGKIEYGYIPTSWDQEALTRFKDRYGIDALVERVIPHLHPERMRHPKTGKLYTPGELKEATRFGLENAMTEGFFSRETLLGTSGGEKLFEMHNHHRFFHFKNYDAWKAVMTEFGNSDIYAVVEQHIGAMTRDIAHMEELSPQPHILIPYMEQKIMQAAATTPTVDQLLRRSQGALTKLAAHLSWSGKGAGSTPQSVQNAIANGLQGVEALADPARVAAITQLIEKHRERLALEQPGRGRPIDVKRVEALLKEIDVIEAAILPESKGVALSAADTIVSMEMKRAFETLRDSETFAGVGDPKAYAEKNIRKARAMWEGMRGHLATPFDIRVGPAFQSFWELPARRRLGVLGLGLMPFTREGRELGLEIVKAPFTGEGQANVRNLLSAFMLQRAVLSAITDPVFGSSTRTFVGMAKQKTYTFRVVYDTIKHFSTMNRAEVERAWFAVDNAASSWQAVTRYGGSVDARMLTGYVADRTMALQGLAGLTAAGKASFLGDFMGEMADNAGRSWNDLNPWLRERLNFHGFTWTDWDRMRTSPLYRKTQTAAPWMRPNEVMAHAGREVAEKYAMMLLREMNHAVPEGTVSSRSTILGDTKPGTLPGELVRSFAQFKSFPMVILHLHLRRLAQELSGGDMRRGAAYAATLLITGTFMGLLAGALKDMAAGRDPKKWLDEETYLDPNTWGAAMMQAGGLGIYGDFLFANLNRHGNSLPATFAGPAVGWLDNIRNLTIGNVQQLLQGKDTKFNAEMIRFARLNTPFVNLWFWGIAWQRILFDQLQLTLDPDAAASMRRQTQRFKTEFNQDMWWQPGETAPRRAPDLNVLRTR